jgi:glyoxylase-like metal-dependent hydrolase (beta-lactamase superfamily II)
MIFATDRQRTRFGKKPRFPEGLYDLENGIYAWMVPNGSWGESNAGLVVGEGESLLVDTLWDVDITSEMLEAMRPITRDTPIKYLVNTHADGDHIWGNELMGDAEIIMTEACDEEAREMKPAAMMLLVESGKALGKLGNRNLKKIGNYFYSMGYPYNFKGIELKAADRTFEKEMALQVGGREVRLIDVGPSHTLGDLVVYVPDAGTLFCGDLIFNGSTPVLWAGPVDNWIAALEMILDMDVDVVVPGHGPVGDKSVVLKLKEYWEYLRREVGKRFNDGMSARDAAYDIALSEDFAAREWSRWDNPERVMTNTHIIYKHLRLRGRPKPVNPVEKFTILWKQGLLAYEIPGAAPASV